MRSFYIMFLWMIDVLHKSFRPFLLLFSGVTIALTGLQNYEVHSLGMVLHISTHHQN